MPSACQKNWHSLLELLFLTLPTHWVPHFLQCAKSDSYFIFICANICKYTLFFPLCSDFYQFSLVHSGKEVGYLAFSLIVYEIRQLCGSHSKKHKGLDLCFTRHKTEMKS